MGANEKKPSIRFTGFTDAWEQRKFGDMAEYKKGPFGSALKKEIFIPKSSDAVKVYEQQNAINKNWKLERYFIEKNYANKLSAFETHAGDILVSCAGTIGEIYELPSDSEPGVINQALMRVRVNEHIVSKNMYKLLFVNMIEDFSKEHSNGSAMKNIPPFADLKPMAVMVPSFKEQEKIGRYFQQLDHLIILNQRKLEKLKNMKKSMMEKMFPQNGSDVPKIRFTGFTDAWEQRKFGDMAEYKKGPFGSALKKEIFIPKSSDAVKVYEQQNAINKNWKLERYFIEKNYANKLSAFETHAGDILVSCAGTIGEIYELPSDSEPGVINQALMRVRVNEHIVSKNMYKLLFVNMIEDFSKEHSNGSAMKNIPPFADLKPMAVMVPSFKEQEKIGRYFQQLDHLITLNQRKLEKLKNMKKSMMEKMFI